MYYYTVLLPLLFDQDFTYSSDKLLDTGDIVLVPFGPRQITGVITKRVENPDYDLKKIKSIEYSYDYLNPINKSLLKLIDWVARYTMNPRGMILKMVFSGTSDGIGKVEKLYTLATDHQSLLLTFKLTPKRKKIIDVLRQNDSGVTLDDLKEISQVGYAVIKKMVDVGIIDVNTNMQKNVVEDISYNFDYKRVDFNTDQQDAVNRLLDIMRQSTQGEYKSKPALLYGVPGSGKTEVYFEAIAQVLTQGKQVLVMLPEIVLSKQWQDRFAKQFGNRVYSWHSDVPVSQKKKLWQGINQGQVKIIVGTRSALFLPYNNLGLIVVDEEHDSSFKQEERPKYNSRDMAIVRANFENIPIILATATPALETYYNSHKVDKYDVLTLTERAQTLRKNKINIVNMLEHRLKKGIFITDLVKDNIRQQITNGKQVIVFLNRRGYAPLTMCKSCGHRIECPNCTATLVEHRKKSRLECHHCGHKQALLTKCPECGENDAMISYGPGVERIAEEISAEIKESKIIIATSDSLSESENVDNFLNSVENNLVNVIISTQVLAKGYHFPNVEMVAILDADTGIDTGDLRATERMWQALYQMSGRAGRSSGDGQIFIQTFNPDHPVMQAMLSENYQDLLDTELSQRRNGNMPPFRRLAVITISCKDQKLLNDFCFYMSNNLPKMQSDQAGILGPAAPHMEKLRNKYRQKFLISINNNLKIQPFIEQWLAQFNCPRQIDIDVDIDPYNTA